MSMNGDRGNPRWEWCEVAVARAVVNEQGERTVQEDGKPRGIRMLVALNHRPRRGSEIQMMRTPICLN